MRRAVLFRSVQRLLGEDDVVIEAAYMWSRHRLMMPFAAVVFAAVALLAPIANIDDWPTRIVIAAAAVAVAVTASTDYSVLAQTGEGTHLFDASKIRQVATRHRARLETRESLAPVGGSGLTTDWQVGDRTYTVPRSSEQAISRIAAERSP